jgi:hypothetical protein
MSYDVLLVAATGRPFQINGRPVPGAEVPDFLAQIVAPRGWFFVVVACLHPGRLGSVDA